MEKQFDPKSYEARWQQRWSELGIFECKASDEDGRPSFCILIPPPNVTGKLHIGHALQSALQDLLVRWKRMAGFNALWLPGTDHAGIATQLMVEKQLVVEGTSRQELGRDRFVERMWEWKELYHSNIRRQLEVMGASCDWSRERFTMDEGLSLAVRTAFVHLFRKGLIYRDEYMVNWSPVLGTAISDLEVESREVQGHLYHFSYPIEGAEGREDGEIVVATTRPETMLGDTAIAVHPDDERYRHLRESRVVLPLVGRFLEVVLDDVVDPEFGTGAVKVTPFHDPTDFEIGRRHELEGVRVIDFDGRMTAEAGADFAGLDRFEARKLVVERMRELGRLVRIEDHVHNVGHSQRSGEPVEPMVSTQWFCNVGPMAARALDAIGSGDLELVPGTWVRTWEHWLTNIRPWVISRQLWWGHQIPAWYTDAGECVVAMDQAEAEQLAGTDQLRRDPDVLDTWFSSGLWPLSTLGWPDRDAPDFRTFYPTQVMVTGHDILFFWVARMVMMGLEFSDEVPFAQVHLTGLVRDAHGDKMSKTRGNVLDPLDLVDEYGADAVRFTLCALDKPGRDIPLDPEVMAGYRAFGNKIWNATRFALSNTGDIKVPPSLSEQPLEAPERWILSRLTHVTAEVERRFESYRFDEACHSLYHFFWGELCDWYIEFTKPVLAGKVERPLVREVLLYALDQSLRLLHPLMPHLTEELWSKLPGSAELGFSCLAVASYPVVVPERLDETLEAEVEALQEVISAIRAVRTERGVSHRQGVELIVEGGPNADFLLSQAALISALANVGSVEVGAGSAAAVRQRVAGYDLALEIEAAPLTDEDRERLHKELGKLEAEMRAAEQRLSNAGFLAKAPPQVVEGSRRRLVELEEQTVRIRGNLEAGG